jgi:hypothetical protein
MTPEEIKTLGHAFFDGKTLQYHGIKDIWEDWIKPYCPGFMNGFKWRIKPDEPKKVKLLAWLEQSTGYLNLRLESFGAPRRADCIRIPELDREITLPEGG